MKPITDEETTPEQITPLLIQLANWCVPNGELHWVPLRIDSTAKFGFCYLNTIRKAATSGGSPVFGWNLRENPDYVSTEWHSVWKSPEGELIDITPLAPGDVLQRILFVVDPSNLLPSILPENRMIPKTVKGRMLRDKYTQVVKMARRRGLDR